MITWGPWRPGSLGLPTTVQTVRGPIVFRRHGMLAEENHGAIHVQIERLLEFWGWA